ncbi:MAG: hypothetical protein J6P13_07685 [Kiritimatiellae bacterium]|nr:hypothetical protein [Kiritimatiellia bacterium]
MPKALLLALAIELPALVDEDVLEPSIQNEVDHAISRAPEDVAPYTNSAERAYLEIFPASTNAPFAATSKTDVAIKTVSAQKADGRWLSGTNDVTAAAIFLLESL